MSWNVYFRVIRDRPLLPNELNELANHSRAAHRRLHDFDLVLALKPDGDPTVAHGQVERYYDPDDADVRFLLGALTRLRDVLPDATVEVWDDFELIGWNGSTAAFDFMGHCDVPRFTLPPPSDARRSVSDLPEEYEFGPDAWAARPVAVPPPSAPGEDVLLTFPDPPTFRMQGDGWRRTLVVQGWVHNPHGVMVQLGCLQLVMRDADGRPVDVLDVGLHQPAAELQFVTGRPEVSPGSVTATRQVELRLDYRYDIAQPLARARLAPIVVPVDDTYRQAIAIHPEPVEPGSLPLITELRAWHGHRHDGYLQVIVELTPGFQPGGLSARARLLCRDASGLAMGADEAHLTFPDGGGPAVASLTVELPRGRLEHVHSLEVDLTGSRDVCAHLGRWSLQIPG